MALPNLSQIQQALDVMLPKLKPIDLPTGTFCHFHTVPAGWLECNGAAVSRKTYADLFKVIGTKYGAGDGSTTFNLPDMNGRVLQATTNHSEVGQMKEASLPNITGEVSMHSAHGMLLHDAYKTGAFSGDGTESEWCITGQTMGGRDLVFDASASNSIYSGANIQPSASLTLLCIKI